MGNKLYYLDMKTVPLYIYAS